MRRTVVALLLIASLAVSVGLAHGAVRGSPDLSASVSDNRVSPGQVTTLGVTVTNAGDIERGSPRNPSAEQRVTTARGLTLRMKSGDAPIDVKTGTVAVGSLPEGSAGPLQFRVAVDEDAEPGTYEVPVVAEYRYTNTIAEEEPNAHSESTVRETLTVTVRVEEGPRFEIVGASTDASVGGGGTIELAVENVGTAAARDATVTVQSPGGALRFGSTPQAETHVGRWNPGEVRVLEFGASVAPDAAARPLSVRTTVSYEDADGAPGEATLVAGVTPADAGQFQVESAETTAHVGGSGEVRVRVRNTGDSAVQDATVQLRSENAALTFGGAATARTFVGTWGPGETRTLIVESSFAPTAQRREYAVDATVSYARDGRTVTAKPVTFGVAPRQQSFALEDVSADLEVGADGTLSGTVRNHGSAAVENAVLVLEPPGNVNAAEREFALGDLPAGETVEFSYDLSVSSSARAGPRQFTFRVRHGGTEGEQTTSDPLYARAEVSPQRNVFTVEPVENAVGNGQSGRLVLSVTNAGDEPLTDISAKLFADDPISVSDSDAFVDRLEPGNSTRIVFGISAAGGMEKTYPTTLDFQYDDRDGDTHVSNTYRVPVEVTEPEGGGGGSLLVFLAGLLVVLAAAGWFGYTRYVG